MKVYKIRNEKSEELREGRSMKYFAEIIDMSMQNFSGAFNGRLNVRKHTAISLISIKEKIPVNDKRMNELLEYYFEEV